MMAYQRTMVAVSAIVALAATACGSSGNDDTTGPGASNGSPNGGSTDGSDFIDDPFEGTDDPSLGEEACGSDLIGIVRDFKDSHPDFEERVAEDRGLVEAQLGQDGKPVYAGGPEGTVTTSGPEAFDQWFRDVPDVNMAVQVSIPLTSNGDGTSTYDNPDFFPIDDQGFGNEERRHNYHFTLELRTKFEYKGGEVFTFRGDDDLFTYINGRLAIDLGGVHGPELATIDLDASAQELGITPGNSYTLDFFFAERHTTESNFRIDTSIGCFTPVVPR
ncbi:uncharacterized protein SOCE26_033720 [Sorangium cellulosum]|uniref:PA14 domain-containing protein n=1 Tax=Sorangium cellulosum TaxID=56 RepID=A0A2L0ERK4_SORCE|nr:fibro-slime domain-containing protein [Sorangium cellulosum]AUX41947.1 uncharacterized protein SOCE26_033720 [Sorangium cellulosum]